MTPCVDVSIVYGQTPDWQGRYPWSADGHQSHCHEVARSVRIVGPGVGVTVGVAVAVAVPPPPGEVAVRVGVGVRVRVGWPGIGVSVGATGVAVGLPAAYGKLVRSQLPHGESSVFS